MSLTERARREVERLVQAYQPSGLADGGKRELTRVMQAEAKRWGMDVLPEHGE